MCGYTLCELLYPILWTEKVNTSKWNISKHHGGTFSEVLLHHYGQVIKMIDKKVLKFIYFNLL